MTDQNSNAHRSKSFPDLFSALVLLHSLLFLGFWLTNSLFYTATNDYLADLVGTPLDYIRMCLGWAALMALWSAARLMGARFLRLGWIFAVLGSTFLVFFYGGFWLLFKEAPVQVRRLLHMLVYFRTALDLLALCVLGAVLVAWLRQVEIRRAAVLPALVVFLLAWALPLLFPPGNVYANSLPAKPRIIAHRGASMLAPENTLAAMRLAAQLGAYGLETDLRFSADRELYLMHDDTLERTTDVAAHFAEQAAQPGESFSLSDLRQLSAGEWFVRDDPYRAVARGRVTSAQVEEFSRQQVPTLAEMLEVVRESGAVFIFDLKQPSQEAAAAEEFFELAFQQVHAASIDAQVWFLADPQQAQVVRDEAPGMQRVRGLDYRRPTDPADLLRDGYQVVNVEYGISPAWVQRYQQAGLWVNLYTVEEPWLFSRLWLSGVDSITTSNLGAMQPMERPLLALPLPLYRLVWSLLGILLGVVLFLRLRGR